MENKEDIKLLNDAEKLTQIMRQHQDAVRRVGESRRVVIRKLRSNKAVSSHRFGVRGYRPCLVRRP